MNTKKKAMDNFGSLLAENNDLPTAPQQKVVPVKENVELDLLQIKIPVSYKHQIKVYTSINRTTITNLITKLLIENKIIDPAK